jgi:hypothetical protein
MTKGCTSGGPENGKFTGHGILTFCGVQWDVIRDTGLMSMAIDAKGAETRATAHVYSRKPVLSFVARY